MARTTGEGRSMSRLRGGVLASLGALHDRVLRRDRRRARHRRRSARRASSRNRTGQRCSAGGAQGVTRRLAADRDTPRGDEARREERPRARRNGRVPQRQARLHAGARAAHARPTKPRGWAGSRRSTSTRSFRFRIRCRTGSQDPTPQPPPGADTPRVNPYMPTRDTGAAQFVNAPPDLGRARHDDRHPRHRSRPRQPGRQRRRARASARSSTGSPTRIRLRTATRRGGCRPAP